jgi:hypothetical protein
MRRKYVECMLIELLYIMIFDVLTAVTLKSKILIFLMLRRVYW